MGSLVLCSAQPEPPCLVSPWSLPPGAHTWPVSSLSTLCLPHVSDRRTQKLGEDVAGWPRAGDCGLSALKQHSWDACAPFSSQGTCYANTQGPTHNGSRQPGCPARPCLHLLSTPLSCPLERGSVGGTGGGPRPGPFLQGRKGLLGWLGMPQRMNGHANEMLMNTDQASPESSPGSCPLSSRQGGAPHPDSPASVGRPSGPSTETFLGGMGSSLGLLPGPYASSFLCLESQPGRCPSSGPDCPQRGPGREGLSVPPLPAPRHNGAVSLLLRSESRGKSLPGQD